MQLAILDSALRAFIEKAPRIPEWQQIHRIADKAVPVVEDLFLMSMQRLREGISINKLVEAYNTGSIGEVERAIPWELFDIKFAEITPVLYGLIVGGGTIAAGEFFEKFGKKLIQKAESPEANFAFNVRNPQAIKWAAEQSSQLIQDVRESTRDGVRSTISNAFTVGGHPYQTAKTIKQSVGLLDSQTKAINSYRQRLVAAKAKNIDGKIERYTAKQLKYRSRNIARTETINAACAGQQAHWNDMIQKGYLDPNTMVKEWITTPDDRLCAQCAEMNGKTAPIDGTFPGGIEHPTLHPSCRCAIGLAEKKGQEISAPEAPAVTGPRYIPNPGFTDSDVLKAFPTLDELGKTIESEGWKRDSIQDQMNAVTGANGLPGIITKEMSDEMEKSGAIRVYRGIRGDTSDETAKFVEEFKRGEFFPGIGVDGNGTYTTASRERAEGYAGHQKEGLLEMMLDLNAKVINDVDLTTRRQIKIASLGPAKSDLDAIIKTAYTDNGRYALSLGYDAIEIDTSAGKTYVILNRTAVSVIEAPKMVVPYNAAKGIENYRVLVKDRYNEIAVNTNTSDYASAKYKKKVDAISDSLVKACAEGTPCIQIDGEYVSSMLDSGRFKSSVELHDVPDAHDRHRILYERDMFGAPVDLDPSKRVIYGHMAHDSVQGWANEYGDVRVTLKRESIADRTSVYTGDTMVYKGHSPFMLGDKPDVLNIHPGDLPKYKNAAEYTSSLDYLELQFHGGVGLEDIDEVLIPTARYEQYKKQGSVVLSQLDKLGVKWRVKDYG